MYAKLFSRITESSLMEEPVETRYVFVMLLAIADPRGFVIGTDVALARRLNIPLPDFQAAVARLKAPDPESNSTEEEGRRLLPSDGERGYQIVNFLKYRSIRDEESRQAYMRNYVSEYRRNGRDKARPVNLVNNGKLGKHRLAQAEAEAEAEEEEEKKDVGAKESRPASVQSDSQWLDSLKADPAYQGIDVAREHARMLRWCQEHAKQPTRRRFVNWLNRVDRPLQAANQTARPDHTKGF